MRMSWKLGRVAGINVSLHPTFLLLLAWPLMTGGDLFVVAVILAAFGCVLLHELGHALTARRFGIETEEIMLSPIGGVARLSRIPRSPRAEVLISLAGPAVNLVILGGLLGLGAFGLSDTWAGSMPGAFYGYLIWVNAMLVSFNLIPAFPMDGGRVLRAALSGPLGRVRATKIAAGIGRGLAVLFGTYSVFTGHPVHAALAAFIYLAAGAELAGVIAEETRRRFDGGRDDDDIWTAPPGYRWVPRGQGAWQLAPSVVTMNDGTSPRWR